VRNEKARLACLNALKEKGAKIGLEMKKTVESPITGGDGNVEYLALWTRA
jgi:predicted rRNA methylase YqxC with S4 and FtsJ domains